MNLSQYIKIPKPKWSTVAIATALFFVFLVLLFPLQNLKGYVFSRIYKETGILVVADDVYLTVFGWPGIGMKKVDVSIPVGQSEFEVTAAKLVVRVGLTGFFPPRPALSLAISGLKKGGDIFIKVAKGASYTKLILDLDEVNLEQFTSNLGKPILLGVMSGYSNVYVDLKDLTQSSGKLDFSIEKFKAPSHPIPELGMTWPNMELGELKLKGQIKNGVAEFQDFHIGNKSSDMSANISGAMQLEKDVQESQLNLNAQFQLSEKFKTSPEASTIMVFFNILDPGKTGNYQIKLNPRIREAMTPLYWTNFLQRLLTQSS